MPWERASKGEAVDTEAGSLYDGSCEVVAALDAIAGRWKLPILWRLAAGPVRYNELKRLVRGVTNTALTRALRELEADGLVERTEYPEVPPRVEYALSPAGRALEPSLEALVSWAGSRARGGVEVRRLAPDDDRTAVAQVYVRTWRAAYAGIVEQAFLDALEPGAWAASLEERAGRTWAAYADGGVAGVCTYGPARDEALAGWGEVVSLYVLPERGGRGIGSRLLDAALDALAAEGFERAYLWVLEDNRGARAFYERRGFAPNGDVMEVEVGGSPLREVRYVRGLIRRS